MKRLKIGLLARIIIAITLGIGFGNVLPGELVRVFVTFNGIFSEFLGFIIPLIILGRSLLPLPISVRRQERCW